MNQGALRLDTDEAAILHGEAGPGAKLAMELVVKLAEVSGAEALVPITRAHIDGCLYHGQAGVDFVERLVDGGSHVAVPSTLNVSSLDLLHPELYRGDDATAAQARRLMDLHVALGCLPTWTCAPYQLAERPSLGDQVAWGESNAIVFANSVLGARTNRYGDFADIACAVVGRAPFSGLHTDEGRLATMAVEVDVEDRLLDDDLLYPLLGDWIGASCGSGVPAIVGLDDRADEDRLKALAAAAASSGSTAMFHVVGVTPEAPTLGDAAGGGDLPSLRVTLDDLSESRRRLGAVGGRLGAVSVGTPHMSKRGLEYLASLVRGSRTRVPFFVSTGRDVAGSVTDDDLAALGAFGATLVTDTCTYITPIIGDVTGLVLTDSAKWAFYAPGNLGVDVALASLGECVASAIAGELRLEGHFTT